MASLQEELKKRQKKKHPDEVIHEARDQKKRDRQQLNKIRKSKVDSEKKAIKSEDRSFKAKRKAKREGTWKSYRERINKARSYADKEFDLLQSNKKQKEDQKIENQKAFDKDYNVYEAYTQRDDLSSEEFAEKSDLGRKLATKETFFKERQEALRSILESQTLTKEAEVGLTRTLEAMEAIEGQFDGTNRGADMYNIPKVSVENQYNPDEIVETPNAQGQTKIDVAKENKLQTEAEAREKFLSKNTPANRAFRDQFGNPTHTEAAANKWDEMRWQKFGKPNYESNLLKNQK